jgi:hypothetical protein
MTFGEALEQCKKGARITRAGWNGKNQFVYYQVGSTVPVDNIRNEPLSTWAREQGLSEVELQGHFDFKPTNNRIQCGWLASQGDMQAEDWMVVEYAEKAKQSPRSMGGDIELPAANIEGLCFNKQTVHAVFDLREDGGWQARDILFMSARNCAPDNRQDSLLDYLNYVDIRTQLGLLVGAWAYDVSVKLPEEAAGHKNYNGVESWYWLAGRSPGLPRHFLSAQGFDIRHSVADLALGCAPVFYAAQQEQAQ